MCGVWGQARPFATRLPRVARGRPPQRRDERGVELRKDGGWHAFGWATVVGLVKGFALPPEMTVFVSPFCLILFRDTDCMGGVSRKGACSGTKCSFLKDQWSAHELYCSFTGRLTVCVFCKTS